MEFLLNSPQAVFSPGTKRGECSKENQGTLDWKKKKMQRPHKRHKNWVAKEEKKVSSFKTPGGLK